MKRLIVLLTTLFPAIISLSQPSQLIIQGEKGKLYLDHMVSAKENWYSLGRMYNINPKQLAPFNGLTLNTPLEIGQQVKVPLVSGNFSQDGVKAPGETLVPVYHIIKEKEWMYHISVTYNKVPIENLEKWNHINKDQAKAGMQLIVGFLKVWTAESALAKSGTGKGVAVAPVVIKDADKTKTTASNATAKEDKTLDAPTKNQVASIQQAQPPVIVTSNVQNSDAPSHVNTYSATHSTGGFFSADFVNGNKVSNGQAATFRSISGWNDGKYYALMNNVPVGTIVKVTSATTSKSVFAKVLGQLPDMKESAGLSIRISNAAAADLGTGEGKFPVEVKY
jgi:hypothetical protein